MVQAFLGSRGATDRTRLAAAVLVSLGPSFLAISGYHGQIDALAILPAALALYVWDRPEPFSSRAVTAGLLIGVGAAFKTVPGLMLLALLPSVRSKRETGELVIATLAPVLLAFAPYVLTAGLPALHTFLYRGVAGVGGLSLLAQPDLPMAFLGIGPETPSPLFQAVTGHGGVITAAGLGLVALIGFRSRASARVMAVVLWLAVYAFGVNFFFQYLLWGLPFSLMAGYVREVALAQAALLIPTAVFYLRPWHHVIVAVAYSTLMILVWAAACCGLGLQARRLLARRPLAPASAPPTHAP